MAKNIIRTSVYSSEDAKLMSEEQAYAEMQRGNCYQYWKVEPSHLKELKNNIRMYRLILSQFPVRSAWSRLVNDHRNKVMGVQL